MSRLDNELFDAVLLSALQRLLHIVNLLAVPRENVVHDDLRRKGATHAVVRELLCEIGLDATDILRAAVVIGRAEAHYQNFLLTDLILV